MSELIEVSLTSQMTPDRLQNSYMIFSWIRSFTNMTLSDLQDQEKSKVITGLPRENHKLIYFRDFASYFQFWDFRKFHLVVTFDDQRVTANLSVFLDHASDLGKNIKYVTGHKLLAIKNLNELFVFFWNFKKLSLFLGLKKKFHKNI